MSPRPTAPPRTPAERDALLAALEDAGGWPVAAAGLLADLGFRLVAPEGSGRPSWHLLVALRDRPTMRHFDPEQIQYYGPADNGALVAVDRCTPGPVGSIVARRALWGHVHVVDRVPVENRFLTFGGDLRMAAVSPQLTVVDLRSPAPIVRWGGHSQGTDELTTAIGAFFGRVIVPVNYVPGAEARVDAAEPDVLYRAFLADALRRAATAGRLHTDRSGFAAWVVAAWRRARRDTPACDAAARLLRDLRLEPPRS